MTHEDRKHAMYEQGRANALSVQTKASSMTGTELYAAKANIPDFKESVAVKSMLNRSAGFVCKSSAGRMVRLLQPYDSSVYTQEPEELPAQWGFAWSTDPDEALEFISLSTSPYNTGDCCIFNEKIYRSIHDNNTWSPSDYPTWWEEVTDSK